MSVIRDVKNIKMSHGDDIVLVKNGNFYRCYEKDAYIISYLMDYQIKQATASTYMCGFPIGTLNKVLDVLENTRVNYRIIDFRREDRTIVKNCDFEERNLYDEVYDKAYKHVSLKRRIEGMCECLINSIDKERNS